MQNATTKNAYLDQNKRRLFPYGLEKIEIQLVII
jgi:hypothetical protein